MHEDTQGRPLLVIRTHDEHGRISSGRMMFSAMHELAHLLFLRLEGGALARIFNDRFGRFPQEYKRRLEGLCNDAASRLLMPNMLLKPTLNLYGHSPKAVLELSRVSGASHGAALRRVLRHSGHEVWGVLIRVVRRVVDGLTHVRGEWMDSVFLSQAVRPGRVWKLPFLPQNHPLLEGDMDYAALELAGGPWEDERPVLCARIGNQRWTRVCVFSFRNEGSRGLSMSGGRV